MPRGFVFPECPFPISQDFSPGGSLGSGSYGGGGFFDVNEDTLLVVDDEILYESHMQLDEEGRCASLFELATEVNSKAT